MKFFVAILIGLVAAVWVAPAHAQFTHERVRRITVFPFEVPKELSEIADDQWWKLREKLTESKRFIVASKNFMQAKNVFQPRKELQPADVLILGRLLDANALVTIFVAERTISMRVYETKNGMTLWSGDIEFHPALPISKQLADAIGKLLFDFTASIPYQGYVIVDSLIGRPAYSEGAKLLFKADVGVGTQITVGDNVQLIRVKAQKMNPLFQDGALIEVYAEGIVLAVDRQTLTVQVTRRQEGEEILAEALVRVPDELRRLREAYGVEESSERHIRIEDIQGTNEVLSLEEKETKPLVVSLSWIGNLALLFLLAF